MTALVQTRQPLQVLSMSNQSKRPRSEKVAAYDDQDGDFQFTRSKRPRTAAPKPDPIPEAEPAPAPLPKKGARTRQTRTLNSLPPSPPFQPAPKRPAKRKSSQVTQDEEEAPPPQPKGTRSTRRNPTQPAQDEVEAPRVKKPIKSKRKATPVEEEVAQEVIADDVEEPVGQETPPPETAKPRGAKGANSMKIALPFADTPVINRNKEMRKKTGDRRSSLGMRGRRASSLIENGNSAIPHHEVSSTQFYKHISDGDLETRRMKQLLVWCAERALAQKPPLGSLNASVIHGARAIQDQLLKDFASKSEFSDWFERVEVAKPPAIIKPNPRNIEHDAKIAELETRIQRLRAEKKTWQSMKQSPPEVSPLFPTPSGEESNKDKPVSLTLPDASLLDPEEAQMLDSLVNSTSTLSLGSSQLRNRLQLLQQSLEFKIDHLADSVHKVEQRVAIAGRQADRVLSLSAARLKEREEKEKASAGTRDMPVMEVLRSLGRILPEGGG